MGVFGIFSSNKFDISAFEKELNKLNAQINRKNQEIIKLHDLKKLIVKNLISYVGMIYVLILSFLIIKLPNNNTNVNSARWFVLNQLKQLWALILGIPGITHIATILFKRLISWLISTREKKVKQLKSLQNGKIKELKNMTNYNTTDQLLKKYDPSQAQPPSRPNVLAPKIPNQPGAPVAAPGRPVKNTQQPNQPLGKGTSGDVPPAAPQPPAKKTLQDRIFDVILGSEDDSIENRYALICKKCFNHCGLAPPNVTNPLEIKYICPYCKCLNGEDMLIPKSPSPVSASSTPVSPKPVGPEAEIAISSDDNSNKSSKETTPIEEKLKEVNEDLQEELKEQSE